MSIRNVIAAVFFSIVAIFLIFSALMIHPFGPDDNQEKFEMDEYIIQNSQEETGADNAVTGVVFDYRGFDTLGEATVLFTAVAGVMLIFRRLKK